MDDGASQENIFHKPCPYSTASWLSKFTIWWMTPMFKFGNKCPITKQCLYEALPEHESSILGERLEREWYKGLKESKLKNKQPSLFWTVLMTFKMEWGLNGIFLVIAQGVNLLQPYLVGQIVSYFQPGSSITQFEVFIYAAVMGASYLLKLLVNPWYFFNSEHIGLKMKVAVASIMYKKILRMSSYSQHKITTGQIINHFSTDLEEFGYIELLHYVWLGPLEIILILYLLYRQLGVLCFVALAVMMVLLPVTLVFGWLFGKLRITIGARGDERIHMMNQIIAGMRVIKMYCWERPFSQNLSQLRKYELAVVWRSMIYRVFTMVIFVSSSQTIAACVFILTWKLGYPLSATIIFSSLGWLQSLRETVFLNLTDVFQETKKLSSSLSRIQSFLVMEDIKVCPNCKVRDNRDSEEETAICIENMTAYWKSTDRTNSTERETFITEEQEMEAQFSLKNINLDIKKGELTAIVGQVGAGKSSLLLSMLSELPPMEGQIWVNGTVGYVSQVPFVVSGSLQENILFGQDMDEERYKRVLGACNLLKDIEQFRQRDQTLVGERGLLLSGGQKTRLTLARAVYKEADIYLLDDPLSAVDTEVGRHIFQQCMLDFLRGKTRVIVTHQLQYLKSADRIIVMNDGRTVKSGTYDELRDQGLELTSLASIPDSDIVQERDVRKNMDTGKESDLHEEEHSEVGVVSWRVYKDYLLAGLPIPLIPALLILIICATASNGISDWHLARWAESHGMIFRTTDQDSSIIQEKLNTSLLHNFNISSNQNDLFKVPFNKSRSFFEEHTIDDNVSSIHFFIRRSTFSVHSDLQKIGSRYTQEDSYIKLDLSTSSLEFYDSSHPMESQINNTGRRSPVPSHFRDQNMHIYIICYVLFVMLMTMYVTSHFRLSVRASRRLHDTMFNIVIGAKTQFFDSNPVGKILNKFARDMGLVDSAIPYYTFAVMNVAFELMGYLAVTIVINPWALLPIIPLVIVIFILRRFSITTIRNINRVQSLTLSPVYSHVSDTLLGLQSIRAMNMNKHFTRDFDRFQNQHSMAHFLSLAAFRWFSFRSMFVVVVYIIIFTFLSLLLKDVIGLTGGLIGLALNYMILFSQPFEFLMLITAELETLMTGVERITFYTKIEQEASKISINPPPSDWPREGKITAVNLGLQYTENTNKVLKDITFCIHSREKVGIVGRTGAGKSSLLAALLRLAEPTGELNIDGVNALDIGLHELRNKISVIPQDPVLFSGTLRMNLDPFQEYSDQQLWNSLEQVHLKDKVKGTDEGLYMEMTEAGQNFSVGQRQLVCLARAILRYNKILVLDEATANVDHKTDELIQLTIRERFQHCTVLTVAHRLHTVMDSDRIMVLDMGKLVEFDTPYNLLQNKEGYFTNLCEQTGKHQSQHLQNLAQKNHFKKNSSL